MLKVQNINNIYQRKSISYLFGPEHTVIECLIELICHWQTVQKLVSGFWHKLQLYFLQSEGPFNIENISSE